MQKQKNPQKAEDVAALELIYFGDFFFKCKYFLHIFFNPCGIIGQCFGDIHHIFSISYSYT
jgi:hypothetical protein